MNWCQRVVMVLGSIAFGVAVFSTPKVCIFQGVIYRCEQMEHLAPQYDLSAIAAYGLVISVATAVLVLACRMKKDE